MKFVEFAKQPASEARRQSIADPTARHENLPWMVFMRNALSDGLSETDIRERCGISPSTLRGWLNGTMEPHALSKPAISRKLTNTIQELATR